MINGLDWLPVAVGLGALVFIIVSGLKKRHERRKYREGPGRWEKEEKESSEYHDHMDLGDA